MPSALLVWQIPYRALSLGLKVVIRRWSRLPFAVLRGVGGGGGGGGARSWSILSLTRRGVSVAKMGDL